MQYRQFGNTGISISALGFGAMRLPQKEEKLDEQLSIDIMRHAFNMGVNYVDTAYVYNSEAAVGKAIKGYEDRVYLSTKYPTWETKSQDDYRKFLDKQMNILDVEKINFYFFHALNKQSFEEKVLGFKLIDEAQKAKEEGLIDYSCFSFHDKPEVMKSIIDTGAFDVVLCQYNMLDRSNEEAIAYAHEKGLGVVVMGPVGGGRLGHPSKTIQGMLPQRRASTPEIALRFVLSNPNVSCALSGMGSMAMVEENVKVASNEEILSEQEVNQIQKATQENAKLAELYCTGCGYCMPCPQEVNISLCFKLMNDFRVYDLPEHARSQYAQIGKVNWMKGKTAVACIDCGECEPKCPQKIPIREQLKETEKILGQGV